MRGKEEEEKIVLVCERGGSYKESASLKCECTFRVRGDILSGGLWSLRVVNGEYKHELTQLSQGHKYVELLQLEEKKFVQEMTGDMVLPRNIVSL